MAGVSCCSVLSNANGCFALPREPVFAGHQVSVFANLFSRCLKYVTRIMFIVIIIMFFSLTLILCGEIFLSKEAFTFRHDHEFSYGRLALL